MSILVLSFLNEHLWHGKLHLQNIILYICLNKKMHCFFSSATAQSPNEKPILHLSDSPMDTKLQILCRKIASIISLKIFKIVVRNRAYVSIYYLYIFFYIYQRSFLKTMEGNTLYKLYTTNVKKMCTMFRNMLVCHTHTPTEFVLLIYSIVINATVVNIKQPATESSLFIPSWYSFEKRIYYSLQAFFHSFDFMDESHILLYTLLHLFMQLMKPFSKAVQHL